jgi:hypothetical protein
MRMMSFRRRVAIAGTALLVFVAAGLQAAVVETASASSGPVFPVMNTSETLPDGVYFRNSPHWDDTNRVFGLGVFAGERVQLECYAWGDAIGPSSNRVWDYVINVSRPTNYDGEPNQGYLSEHYINDGIAANTPDPGVPECGSPPTTTSPPPPAPQPHISLSQGATAPAGFWYDIAFSGFAADARVTATCMDSVSSVRTFTLQMSAGGTASGDGECYSNDGPDHWVATGSVVSNHVQWGPSKTQGGGQQGSQGGGGAGSPPQETQHDEPPPSYIAYPSLPSGSGLSKEPPASLLTQAHYAYLVAEFQTLMTFCLDVGFQNCYRSGEWYLGASGADFYLDFGSLMQALPTLQGQLQYWLRYNVGALVSQLRATPASSSVLKTFDTGGPSQNWFVFHQSAGYSDWYYTLGDFSVRMLGDVWIGAADSSGNREIRVSYRSFVFDTYDFAPGSKFGSFADLAAHGMAATFHEEGSSATIQKSASASSFDPSTLPLQW